MNRFWVVVLPVVVVLFTTVVSVHAKAPTVRLTIVGPGLAQPVELASPDAVAANVYEGNFIATRTSAPDPGLPRFIVSFFAGNPVRMMYVVQYVRSPKTGRALIYLPGPGDDGYRLNVQTILRGQEGEWHVADVAWSNAVAKALPRQ